jgi:RNA polymerase sigma-70 factor (ECF subfamily)
VEETAEAVGSTPGAVRVAQHRALSRLRDLLTTTPSAGPKAKAAATNAAGSNEQPPLFTEWTAGGRAVW